MAEQLRWILHIDMDAFFASVEQMDNPDLRGLPVVVGSPSQRGVIAAASYEARKFGVRSAMSSVKAQQLCPHLVFVKGKRGRYSEVSRKVMGALGEFSPVVEKASIDEAYLDGSGLERLFGPIEELGMAIKRRVREASGLTCSVGAAPIRFLAKIASDLNKPDGLSVIHHRNMDAFVQQLPVGRVPGVGKRMQDALRSLGVKTCDDVRRFPREFWEERFGKGGGILYDRSMGIDPNPVVSYSEPKSCSAENTFEVDTVDRELLRRWLLQQAERVGADLRKHGLAGRTVTLKVKFADFRQITRSASLDALTDETDIIWQTACNLLKGVELRNAVRLIGVGVSNFKGTTERQLSLFDEPEKAKKPESRRELDKAVDAVRARFGKGALTRGELMGFRKKK